MPRSVALSIAALITVGAGTLFATPAAAQFFLSIPDLRTPPVKGDERGIGEPMPGATEAEVQAELVWNLRSALNVAALQCQFEPSLLSVTNYNIILENHKDELKKSFDTLSKYFGRVTKVKKEGQGNLDRFSTRAYSGFTAVAGQYGFCQVAGSVARAAVFAPRGTLHTLAAERMGELRRSLIQFGEQTYPGGLRIDVRTPRLPRLDDLCWDKRGDWVGRKCGAYQIS
ncbi:MAG: hypothetical protein ABIS14_13250 [Sphingomonas sp.]